jgi:hypothetical protein
MWFRTGIAKLGEAGPPQTDDLTIETLKKRGAILLRERLRATGDFAGRAQ